MKQVVENFVNTEFKTRFNVNCTVLTGDLTNYKSLPSGKGIYFLYCDDLGISYIGMTEKNVQNRFDKHVARADSGKDFDPANPHKVWDYFHKWCKKHSYSLKRNGKYVFVSLHDDLSKKEIKFLENGAIYQLGPLLNDECFDWLGFDKLENFSYTNQENNLFTFE